MSKTASGKIFRVTWPPGLLEDIGSEADFNGIERSDWLKQLVIAWMLKWHGRKVFLGTLSETIATPPTLESPKSH